MFLAGRDQGKRQEARQLLVWLYGWFTEGFDTGKLQGGQDVAGGVGGVSYRD